MKIQEVRALVASACVDAANPALKAYFPLWVAKSSDPLCSRANSNEDTSASARSLLSNVQHRLCRMD